MENKSSHVVRNRIILFVVLLMIAGFVAFVLIRRNQAKTDSETKVETSATDVVASSPVKEVSDSTSAYTDYSDGTSTISNGAVTSDSVSTYSEISHDPNVSYALSVFSFEDINAQMKLYGDGVHYVLTISGSVTNIGTEEGGWTSLPAISVNDIPLECSLATEPLRSKGNSLYKYQCVMDTLPDTFTVNVNGSVATEAHYDAVAKNAEIAAKSLGEVMDNMDPAYTGATAFDGGTTDNAVIAKALAHECAVLDYGNCSSSIIYAKGLKDGGIYTLINPKFTYDNAGGTFSCQLRNNLYTQTKDAVRFTLMIFANDDVIGRYTVDSEKPLAAGELLDVEVYIEGLPQDANWGMTDITGF